MTTTQQLPRLQEEFDRHIGTLTKVPNKFKLPVFNLEKLLEHIQVQVDKAPSGIVQLVVDLFCGAGGTSEGFEQSYVNGNKTTIIIAGVNHDYKAIYSQAINHPLAYYSTEDIRHANLVPIGRIMYECRQRWPQCPIYVWGSLECTNHSNAKGGQSRDADSRTLADHLFRYIEMLNPDGLWIENVKEFAEWGPLHPKVIMQTVVKGKVIKKAFGDPIPADTEEEFFRINMEKGAVFYCPLEKVKEKLSPTKKGKQVGVAATMIPVKKLKGSMFMPWRDRVNSYGYHSEQRIINAANHGTPQNRLRLFIIFVRTGWPILWPAATHAKDGANGLKPLVPVKNCLDLTKKGESIFTPGKIKSDRTFTKIYDGLVKFVAGGKEQHRQNLQSYNGSTVPVTAEDNHRYFITKYMSNNPKTLSHPGNSIDDPSCAVPTSNRMALTDVSFMTKYHKTGENVTSCDDACSTITCKDRLALMQTETFLFTQYINGNTSSLNSPSSTVVNIPKQKLIDAEPFILNQYKTTTSTSIEVPCNTVTNIPKQNLVSTDPFILNPQFDRNCETIEDPANTLLACRKHRYIINPSWGRHIGDVNNPSFTVVARQDKAPLYLLEAEDESIEAVLIIPVYDTDSDIMVKIKSFMAMYGIRDITMRMLLVEELLLIQSFPKDYFLAGTDTDKKKFIGNAVPPFVAKAISTANYFALVKFMTGENLYEVAA